ncbi:MAG: cobalamin-binding protein, partial [Euryarchaeota archaeon]|nr:cobalamin-binding protein [Euryarchaeota archaeon]
MRIASLLPSATEIVYALGLGDRLVARSPECDHPPEVVAKPVISASVLDGTAMDSPEIDATVRRHMYGPEGMGSLYHLDVDKLRALKPDLLLTQALCDVCAASVDEVRSAVGELDYAPEILSLDPTSLDDILEDVLAVGAKT